MFGERVLNFRTALLSHYPLVHNMMKTATDPRKPINEYLRMKRIVNELMKKTICDLSSKIEMLQNKKVKINKE